MKARNRQHYIDAWQSHVKELIHVHIDADVPMEAWDQFRNMMTIVIERAADNTFGKEEKLQ